MHCANCGAKQNGDETYCANCGSMVQKISNNINPNQISKSGVPEILKKIGNLLSHIYDKIRIIAGKYKKRILIILAILTVIFMVMLSYNKFIGFEKLSWDETYLYNNTKYLTQSTIKLGVNFTNEQKINDIKYETTCGELITDGLELTWNLSDATGKCEIRASYKFKTISKTLYVMAFDLENRDFALEYSINEDSEEDLDFDGLTNKQEKEYKTNPQVADTDLDGLDDNYEIFTSKTDPNKKDSDDDGLSDYDEIKQGLDPLKKDSKGDGISDGERELTYNYDSDKLKISITGNGNISSTIAQINSNTKISSKLGIIDNLYTLYTDGEEDLSIYYYNDKEQKYEKIESTIDKESKTVSAKLNHFSNYVLGDSSKVKETNTNQLLFILDNSWSMYNNEQYKKITGKDYYGGLFGTLELAGYDSEGLRFTLTSNLISKLSSKNFQIGLSEFRSDYANAAPIGSDSETLEKQLAKMNGNFITSIAGTDIEYALKEGIKEFSKESDNKYIIILTDGEDSSLSSYTKSIIEKAISKDVKICSIGFGGGTNNVELSKISNGTGCKFYSSSNAMGLVELFNNLETELNDNLVDVTSDNKPDGILLADSGFVVNRDGFSFGNYGSNLTNGHCYGMATVAELYYKKLLPLKMESKTVNNLKSYAYNLENTYFKNYSNLYDYKLKTNVLKYTFGYEIFDEEQPADLQYLNGETLGINEIYKKEMQNSGFYDFYKEKSKLDSKAQLKKRGFTYSDVENYIINEDHMQKSSIIENSDLQLLNAIYAAFIRQKKVAHYASSSNFIMWLRNVIGTEQTDYVGATGFINILKERLNDKDAPVISSSYSGGLHAINAISLAQDIENPNVYYIGVYDNNYPGEKRYVDVECNKNTCVTKANSYYTASGEPIRITPSLEYDLEYFNE